MPVACVSALRRTAASDQPSGHSALVAVADAIGFAVHGAGDESIAQSFAILPKVTRSRALADNLSSMFPVAEKDSVDRHKIVRAEHDKDYRILALMDGRCSASSVLRRRADSMSVGSGSGEPTSNAHSA